MSVEFYEIVLKTQKIQLYASYKILYLITSSKLCFYIQILKEVHFIFDLQNME